MLSDRFSNFYTQGRNSGSLLDLLVTQGVISPLYEGGVKPVIMEIGRAHV